MKDFKKNSERTVKINKTGFVRIEQCEQMATLITKIMTVRHVKRAVHSGTVMTWMEFVVCDVRASLRELVMG